MENNMIETPLGDIAFGTRIKVSDGEFTAESENLIFVDYDPDRRFPWKVVATSEEQCFEKGEVYGTYTFKNAQIINYGG